MLSNFLGCPTIDDEATKKEEQQPVLNRETEDTRGPSRLSCKQRSWSKIQGTEKRAYLETLGTRFYDYLVPKILTY